jgi:hypothetical protein
MPNYFYVNGLLFRNKDAFLQYLAENSDKELVVRVSNTYVLPDPMEQ